MATIDIFKFASPNILGPYTHAYVITPNDNAELPFAVRALYIGGAGTIKLTLRDDQGLNVNNQGGGPVTLGTVTAGQILAMWTRQVWATGTSATPIIGLY